MVGNTYRDNNACYYGCLVILRYYYISFGTGVRDDGSPVEDVDDEHAEQSKPYKDPDEEMEETMRMWEALSLEDNIEKKNETRETEQKNRKNNTETFRISQSLKKELSIILKRCNLNALKIQAKQKSNTGTVLNAKEHEASVERDSNEKITLPEEGTMVVKYSKNDMGSPGTEHEKEAFTPRNKGVSRKKLGLSFKRRNLWKERQAWKIREVAALTFLNHGMKDAIKESYFENSTIDFNAVISPLTTMDVNAEALYKLHHTRRAMVVQYLQSKDWLALDLLHALNVICK